VSLAPLGAGSYRLAFTAPGDNGPCGTPASYVTRLDGRLVDLGLGSPGAGGTPISAEVSIPGGARRLSIQARDGAGNLGPAASVAVR
jgi:hypothetical protein